MAIKLSNIHASKSFSIFMYVCVCLYLWWKFSILSQNCRSSLIEQKISSLLLFSQCAIFFVGIRNTTYNSTKLSNITIFRLLEKLQTSVSYSTIYYVIGPCNTMSDPRYVGNRMKVIVDRGCVNVAQHNKGFTTRKPCREYLDCGDPHRWLQPARVYWNSEYATRHILHFGTNADTGNRHNKVIFPFSITKNVINNLQVFYALLYRSWSVTRTTLPLMITLSRFLLYCFLSLGPPIFLVRP